MDGTLIEVDQPNKKLMLPMISNKNNGKYGYFEKKSLKMDE